MSKRKQRVNKQLRFYVKTERPLVVPLKRPFGTGHLDMDHVKTRDANKRMIDMCEWMLELARKLKARGGLE